MTIPRQVLYGVESFKSLARGLTDTLNQGNYAESSNTFEREFSKQLGIENIIPLSRCRLGLYLALHEILDSDRKEVIMCPFTIFDIVNMVLLAGGQPVFVDSMPDSVDPSPDSIESLINNKTAAVIITHYHVPNPAIEKIALLCEYHGIYLIEDCAIAIGESVNHKSVGSFGDFGLFSFGLYKTIAAPYGGALYVKDEKLKQNIVLRISKYKLSTLRDLQPYLNRSFIIRLITHPALFRGVFFPVFNLAQRYQIRALLSKLDNDPNAMLRSEIPEQWLVKPTILQLESWSNQFKELSSILTHRNAIAQIYLKHFANREGISAPRIDQSRKITSGFSTFPILVDANKREKLITTVMEAGYDVSKHFYKNCATLEIFSSNKATLPNLDRYCSQMLCLPTHLRVTPDYANRLATVISSTIKNL